MLFGVGNARASTLFFQASLDSMGNINDLWSTVGNWYFSLNPTPMPANRLPNSEDSAVITTAVVVDVPSVILQTMIVESVNVDGGLFSIGTLQTTAASAFLGSTITVKSEWDLYNDASLSDCTVFIDSGAIWYVEQESTGNDVELNNCSITNIGGITLYDKSVIDFVAGTNALALLDGAQLVGNGVSGVEDGGNYLTFDNNGSVVGNAGTLSLSFGVNTFWTDTQNVGNFFTASNGVIEILGTYELQPGTTNKVYGPGLTWFYGSISDGSINGLLQIGDTNAGPGTV